MLVELNPFQRWARRQNAIPHPKIVELSVATVVSHLQQQSQVSEVELPLLARPAVVTTAFAILVPEPVSADLAAWDVLDLVDVLPPIQQPALDAADGGFAPLTNPEVSVDLADISARAPVDCLPELLDEAPHICDEHFTRLTPPGNKMIELVDMLMAPAILDLFVALTNPGKAGKSYAAKQEASFDPQPTLLPDIEEKRCRHGLPKDQCDICQEQARKASARTQPKKVPGARTVDVFDLLLPYLQPPVDIQLTNPLLFPAGQRPYDYQIEGIKFLAERDAVLLGDEMGLGKTIQAIVALQVLYRQGKVRETLIVCPRSLLGTWERELNKWAPELFVLRVRGSRTERAYLWKAPASVYLTNYETLRQDGSMIPGREKFQVIILDEAQRIKNRNTDVARAVHGIKAQVRWALSGTPLENKIEDLISIFSYLKPGLFTQKWLMPDGVKRAIAPYFLRRRTADVRQELPEKLTNEIWLELNDAQRRAYDAEERKGKAQLEDPNATRMHVFALINKLKQICNLDPLSKTSCKLDYLTDQLDSIVESGEKALVFSHLPQVTLDQIKPHLDEFGALVFDGRLSDSQREHIINGFQSRESSSVNVLLMSVQAGGVGLTLTAASHVFHYDHWWNPAIAKQAEGRAHRIGQDRTVFVHDLYTLGTIEQRIHQLLQEKQALFDDIIDDLSADYVQGKFTDEDLFGLFDLAVPTPASAQQSSQVAPSMRVVAQNDAPRPALDRLSSTIKNIPKMAELNRLDPFEFEQFMAQLYERMGYRTKLTSKSGDHGVDVIARRATEHGVEKIIIQCKHKPNGVVGEPEVRDLVGAWQEHDDARYAVLATTGTFSNAAKIMSDKRKVTLYDRLDIERLYTRYVRKSV